MTAGEGRGRVDLHRASLVDGIVTRLCGCRTGIQTIDGAPGIDVCGKVERRAHGQIQHGMQRPPFRPPKCTLKPDTFPIDHRPQNK